MKSVLITGGCGFIGSHLILHLMDKYPGMRIVNFDCLTYAADTLYLKSVYTDDNYLLVMEDIRDEKQVERVIKQYEIDSIIHLAAESHVDNSINNPSEFVSTNINGTMVLLEAFRKYCSGRFHYVSTDEIYGALGPTGEFTEDSPLAPNSPYSASKAAAGLMVRSYYKTFNLDVVTTSCSNNYGPHQHAEKLIPTVIRTAAAGDPIPVYGNGSNVRDWLYVKDHCEAIDLVFHHGRAGETYNVGGDNELSNLELIKHICHIMDEIHPGDTPYADQITFVEDRKGHDFRYAVCADKIKSELSWQPRGCFHKLLEQTINYYV